MLLIFQLFGRELSPYLLKMLKIVASLIILGMAYLWFRDDIYLWFCEEEQSSAACTIVGMTNEKQHYYESADSYYEKACKQDYALACFKRGLLASERKQEELAQGSFQKACKLEHKAACTLIEPRK